MVKLEEKAEFVGQGKYLNMQEISPFNTNDAFVENNTTVIVEEP